jgi:adenylate cyclase
MSAHAPELELPDKPSIAVLPLDNMSHDPDQDFLGDGISEDIITALSKFQSLFVIARNSSFFFKGKQLEIRDIGKRLGVRYVVEGSVRRVDNRVRISAQLIDAVEDRNIWAERYDRELEDIFAVQDEVTLSIVQAIEPHLTSAEQQRALRKPPENLDAWENYQRGMWHLLTYQPKECESAIFYLKRAVELDPSFARAIACLGFAYGTRVLHDISPDREADIEKALAAGREAVQIDEYEAFAYLTTARTTIFQRRYDDAIAAADRAIQLNPNFALAHMIRGHALWHAGRPREAVESIDTAIRASPHASILWVFFASKAIALVMLECFDEAISVSRVAQQHPNAAIYAYLGEMSALGHKGDTQAAADAITRAKIVKPDVSVSYVDKVLPVADPVCRELFLGGLRKAGLP